MCNVLLEMNIVAIFRIVKLKRCLNSSDVFKYQR